MMYCLALPVAAEVYIYQGPNGERMISDRPQQGYSLLTKRDSLKDAGHIMANRPLETGGPTSFQYHIRKASEDYLLDPALIEAVIQVESSFRPDAVSKSGAAGLMQLMPATADELNVNDRYSPRQNINGGAKYLRKMLDRFDDDLTLAVAAYNAGPGAVERAGGIPDRPETQRYVKKVMSAYQDFRNLRYGNGQNRVRWQ